MLFNAQADSIDFDDSVDSVDSVGLLGSVDSVDSIDVFGANPRLTTQVCPRGYSVRGHMLSCVLYAHVVITFSLTKLIGLSHFSLVQREMPEAPVGNGGPTGNGQQPPSARRWWSVKLGTIIIML